MTSAGRGTDWEPVYQQLGLVHESREEQSFWLRLSRAPLDRPEKDESRMRFLMGMIAYNSQQLENAGWDRWELHTDALLEAYNMGRRGEKFTIFHFLKWHSKILPFGGHLRDCNPVSVGMGDSFSPIPAHRVAIEVNLFVRNWFDGLEKSGDLHTMLKLLARRHFDQWRNHPYSDGNKRHARLMTVYGCGYLGLDPVCITLAHKKEYLDMLDAADIVGLARLFEQCQVALV